MKSLNKWVCGQKGSDQEWEEVDYHSHTMSLSIWKISGTWNQSLKVSLQLQLSSCQIGGRHCLLDKTNWKNNRSTNVTFTISVLVSASHQEDPQIEIETFESAVWFKLVVQLCSKIRLESSWKLSNLILYIWNSSVLSWGKLFFEKTNESLLFRFIRFFGLGQNPKLSR